MDYINYNLTDEHIRTLRRAANLREHDISYKKDGVFIKMKTLGFTASGVLDRTNLNFLRQYIGHTMGKFLPGSIGRDAPLKEFGVHISTGDDGLRACYPEYEGQVKRWFDFLYFPKKKLEKDAPTLATTGWLRKSNHEASNIP